MNIKVVDCLPCLEPSHYKVHLASWNGANHPLDVFVRDQQEWYDWNRWRGQKDDFNREYIFSLIDFHTEKDTWLFGGIFQVLKRKKAARAHSYTIEPVMLASNFIGRLKISFKRPSRGRSLCLEKYYSQMIVAEILKTPFTGTQFCGFENIDHDFSFLETVFKNSRPDWRAALQNVKGVYLITDKKNGKKYIGSAYGDTGIWSRWACYMGTGHGWTDELTQLIKLEGLDYARKYFKFALLEHRSMRADDKVIIARETYWKQALMTRVPLGYNKN